jgi:DNA-binding transcriptional ArsR family regulator
MEANRATVIVYWKLFSMNSCAFFTDSSSCFFCQKKNLRNQKVSYFCNRLVTQLKRIMRRDVFQAIADPTRRAIINMIAHQSLNLNSVAENFDVSRPAISKHIKILTECGLVVIKQRGRERYCEAKLEKLHEVSDFVEQYRRLWTAKFDALETYLNIVQTKKKKMAETKKPGSVSESR